MPALLHPSFYSNEDLCNLQKAFNLASADLRLNTEDFVARERLGRLLFEMAAAGFNDCVGLRREAVRQFGHACHPAEGYSLPAGW